MKCILMVGLQGSGKSTKAKELATKYEATILSSDAYRKNKAFAGADNSAIFNALYTEAKRLLEAGTNVIIDATNTSIKARRSAIERLKNTNCDFVAYIMNTPYEVCVQRVTERNNDEEQHIVPLTVLAKYLISFEIPFFEEGFAEIILDHTDRYSTSARSLNLLLMRDFDQKTPHHDFKLLEHCTNVAGYLPEQSKEIGMLHDIGKMFTQTFDEKGVAHYYGHHNAGAYYVMSNTAITEVREDLLDLLFMINYHMYPFQWQSEKAKNKWRGIFGDTKYEALVKFNEIDKKGAKR